MTLTIFQVDAFTSNLFGGNPAAVVPLTTWLTASEMQKIAAENNISETAFFVPHGDDFEIRWFTPEFEIDLCGHATLATAHLLFTELGYVHSEIRFHTLKAGILIISRKNDLEVEVQVMIILLFAIMMTLFIVEVCVFRRIGNKLFKYP